MEAPISPDAIAAAASALTRARSAGQALDAYPGPMPQTMAEAYALQDAAIALWPDAIAGWKLGRIPVHLQAENGGRKKLAGPVFSGCVLQSPARFQAIRAGLCAVEGELIVRIGRDLPVGPLPNRDDLAAAIVAAWAGIEMASSPYRGMNDHGPAVTASDFGVNGALVIGTELPLHAVLDGDFACAVSIDGAQQGEARFCDVLGDPVSILAELLEILFERGRGLKAGDLVSTGAITGVHAIAPGQFGQARFIIDGQTQIVDVTVN